SVHVLYGAGPEFRRWRDLLSPASRGFMRDMCRRETGESRSGFSILSFLTRRHNASQFFVHLPSLYKLYTPPRPDSTPRSNGAPDAFARVSCKASTPIDACFHRRTKAVCAYAGYARRSRIPSKLRGEWIGAGLEITDSLELEERKIYLETTDRKTWRDYSNFSSGGWPRYAGQRSRDHL